MDESDRLHSLKTHEKIILFDKNPLQTVHRHENENLSKEFARYFSIDDDDDDIILLDQSQVILDEVKNVLNNLINTILHQEKHPSQIVDLHRKRSMNLNDEEDYLLNKKVRFNFPDETEKEHQSIQLSSSLFISDTTDSTNQLKPYAQFLYNLGLDLCLEQTLNNNSELSEPQKQELIRHNKVFHQHHVYSCKYCSFKTDTIHAMNYHYRTPHTLSKAIYPHLKYRCTYCSFQTFRLPVLRRHFERKHGYLLISEHSLRRYQCSYCCYETDDKNNFIKHNNRCQIEQTRTRLANNLLAPNDQINPNITTGNTKSNKNHTVTKKLSPSTISSSLNTRESLINNEIIEPILIESDHDTASISRTSSSDDDFIVSSDERNSSSTNSVNGHNRDFEILESRSKKTSKPTALVTSQPIQIPTSASTTLSSLTKLLLLNGTPIQPSAIFNSVKAPTISIQPKPTMTNSDYQMCSICQCYIYKKDYTKHMNDKHNHSLIESSQTTFTNAITILNNTTNSINPTITCLTPTLVITKTTPQPPTTIFLLSTSTKDPQSITLNMIKCPWCDTNFEHIDVMTGHLMRYHRMTLAAAKVVVAEQMKIQGTSSSQLASMFKEEINQIQKDFTDKIYWKISQPKVYLHQIENFACFVCHMNVDDVENHFLSTHQISLATMKTIKQCCLCGFQCDEKNSSLFEHQLRTHSGVCYSSILKQFIRFEPSPPPLSRTIIPKDNILPSSSSSSSSQRTLTTYTEKKFGCRKCETSSRLFTFDELVEHLRLNHTLNVKLHRRCSICQQTYVKGKEYNQHCLEHLKEENPTIEIKRQRRV